MKDLVRFEPYLGSYLFSHSGQLYVADTSAVEKFKNSENTLISKPCGNPVNGLSVPTKVQIQFTNRCNMACPHCYVTSGTALSNEMSDVEIKNLLTTLQQWGVLQIEWSGGEVFTRKNFLHFVELSHELGFEQNLLTNGFVFGKKPELISTFWKYLRSIQISMDSVDQDFNKWVGKEMWATVKKAVSEVWARKPVNAQFSVTTTLDSSNIQALPQIADTLNGLCDNWKLGRQVQNGRSLLSEQKADAALFSSWDIVQKIKEQYPNMKIVHPFDKEELKQSFWPIEWTTEPGGRWFMYISASGETYPFPYFDSVKEFNGGNILTKNPKEIWNSDEFNTFRSATRENTGCAGCKKTCNMWVRAFNYFEGKDIYKIPVGHPNCPR